MQRVEILTEQDIVAARQAARQEAIRLGFSLVDQTRITTAVSELARNIYCYAGTGWMDYVEVGQVGFSKGLEFIFRDHGPGISDIPLAMTLGYSGGQGLGLGLGGAKRLMDDFDINSAPGNGTTIRIVKWLD